MSKKAKAPSQASANPIPDVEDGSDNDYKAKNAMDDLLRAEQHKQNPHLMKRVHSIAGRHAKALKSIKDTKGLRDLYNQKYHGEEPKED